jgi:hypothetical protein
MRCCCNVKGFITSIDIKTGKVQVKAEDGKTYSGVQLISPLGTNTVPQITINAEILLQKSLGSDDSVFGIPFNRIQQFTTLPLESQGDYAVGSTVGKNNITFKASGKTVENATSKELSVEEYNVTSYNETNFDGDVTNINSQMVNIEATTEANINAPIVNLGDGTIFVLNQNATMQVVIPVGSSAGTYPVQIISAGQIKVKA